MCGFTYTCDNNKAYFFDFAHFPLASFFFEERQDFVTEEKYISQSRAYDELLQEINSTENDIVISCEHFSSRIESLEQIEQIASFFPNMEKKIICYLRPQQHLMLAGYSTAIRSGRRDILSLDEVHPDFKYFNYIRYLDLWADVFGAENMIVKNYERDAFPGGDVRRDFLSILGIDQVDDFIFEPDSNVSLDAKQVESLRLINRFLPAFGEASNADYDLGQQLRGIIEPHLPKGVPLKALVGLDEVHEVQERFAPVNAQIEERFLSPGALATWRSAATALSRASMPALSADAVEPSPEDLAETIASLAQEIYRLRLEIGQASDTRAAEAPPEPEADLAETVAGLVQEVQHLRLELEQTRAGPAEPSREELAETIASLAQEVHSQRLELEEFHARRHRSIMRRAERRFRHMRRKLWGGIPDPS